MKTHQLSATIALTGLLALGGSAFAADNAHSAYNHAFYGTSISHMDSHGMKQAATTPFMAPKGGTRVLTTTGLASWKQPTEPTMGKAAYGTPSQGTTNGLKAYHSVFISD